MFRQLIKQIHLFSWKTFLFIITFVVSLIVERVICSMLIGWDHLTCYCNLLGGDRIIVVQVRKFWEVINIRLNDESVRTLSTDLWHIKVITLVFTQPFKASGTSHTSINCSQQCKAMSVHHQLQQSDGRWCLLYLKKWKYTHIMLEVRVLMWMIQTYQFSVINTLKF